VVCLERLPHTHYAVRLMQNIQDVENSKKIVLVDDELTKTTNGIKMGTHSIWKFGHRDFFEFPYYAQWPFL
jgi:hypothetical protein